MNRIDRGVEKVQPEVQLPEDGDGHVAASSVTVAVRPDGAGGSIQTTYTQSDRGAFAGPGAPG